MKGVIFNLLEQFIAENFGEEKYEEIVTECALKTGEPFVGPGTYPDEDLIAIVSRAVETLGIAPPEALHGFGRFCFPKLAEKFPDFVQPFKHPKPFMKTIDSVIHVEVKKLFKDAEPPRFIYEEPSADRLIITYKSRRKLCLFMEGLIDGVADYYSSPITYEQRICMLDGGEVCEFDLAYSPEGRSAS